MSMNFDWEKLIPGAVGSAISMYWFRDLKWKMVIMFLGGVALAYYGTPYVYKTGGGSLDSGIIGFLLGLFGMTVVASVFNMWSGIGFTQLAKEWLRGFLRLPPLTDKDAAK